VAPLGESLMGGGPSWEVCSPMGDALKRGDHSESCASQGGGLAPSMGSDHAVNAPAPPPAASGPGCRPHPVLAGPSIWPCVHDLLNTSSRTWRLLLRGRVRSALRVRCACSPPVVARSPPAPGRAVERIEALPADLLTKLLTFLFQLASCCVAVADRALIPARDPLPA